MGTPTRSLTSAAYLRWTLLTTAAVLAAVALFNIFIDPMGVFNAPRIAGLNAIKPHLDHHHELVRWKAAQRLCAGDDLRTGIFGNSRAEVGFDPLNRPLVEHRLKAYDHAIPGAGAATAYRQLQWLEEAGCLPKTVFLGVEFFDFLGDHKPADVAALKATKAPAIDGPFLAETVFSLTGLRDSLETLSIQNARYPAVLTERGFNPLNNYIPDAAQYGYHALFRQKAQQYAQSWAARAHLIRPASGGISNDEQAVDAFIARASAAEGTVYVVIYPYHAEVRVILERLGLGGLFAEWKKLIVELAARQARQGRRVEVWDFSGLSPQTLESIPAAGDRKTQLKWFWEPGHFKPALGELAFERMLGAPNGFGVRLDSSNVDAWVEQDRRQVQALMSVPSPLLVEVDSLLSGRP